ncbi:hypothetical protein GYMLUDRAFT_251993 [Collybiopsis luxurians FD-317 M1]|uniref:Uncharacterized protein n=1 Tax=Collybiopsis luxurians FD-317 M1 TaxID=944289 RepID=A0A0D0BB59_9AGAR|nr:hypothetical protein GYMLUDRAFT_251993 [Collybiopsis luxurians FD-317 M1]
MVSGNKLSTTFTNSSIPSFTTLLSTSTYLSRTTSNILSAPATSPSLVSYSDSPAVKSASGSGGGGFTLFSILPLPSGYSSGSAGSTTADSANQPSQLASSSGSFSSIANDNDLSDTSFIDSAESQSPSRTVSGSAVGTQDFSENSSSESSTISLSTLSTWISGTESPVAQQPSLKNSSTENHNSASTAVITGSVTAGSQQPSSAQNHQSSAATVVITGSVTGSQPPSLTQNHKSTASSVVMTGRVTGSMLTLVTIAVSVLFALS